MTDSQTQKVIDDAVQQDPALAAAIFDRGLEPNYASITKIRDIGFHARRLTFLEQNYGRGVSILESQDAFGTYQISYRPTLVIIAAVAFLLTAVFGAYGYIKASDSQLQQSAVNIQQANDEAIQSVQHQIDTLYGQTTALQRHRNGVYGVSQEDFTATLTGQPHNDSLYESIDLALRLDDGTIVENARLIRQASDSPEISHTAHIEIPVNDQSDQYQTYAIP